MRRVLAAGLLAMVGCAPATAADLGIPIDIFGDVYRSRLDRLERFVSVPDVDCRRRTRCLFDLGGGVFLIVTTARGTDMVDDAELGVQLSGTLSTDRFTAASDGLMALLSSSLTASDRSSALADLVRRTAPAATADIGATRYTLRKRSDGTLTFEATRP